MMSTSKRATTRSSKQSFDSPSEEYHNDLKVRFSDGDLNPTEHSYRPSLQNFLEDLLDDHQATNEPQRIACGAPDLILTKANIPVGYIECKDLEKDLDAEMKSDQM